jgi:SNF2 family DNA or RNA helicase
MINKATLEKYIKTNAPSVIRTRAKSIIVQQVQFFEKNNKASISVLGSAGALYIVKYSNLIKGEINSSCTCPYDFGGICKHEVAAATEILDALRLTEKKVPKYTIGGVYVIPYLGIAGLIRGFFREHCSEASFNKLMYRDYKIEVKEFFPSKITAGVLSDQYSYYADENAQVTIEKEQNELRLKCSCSSTNEKMCIHQAVLLDHLKNNLPQAFMTNKEVDVEKEKMLNDLGLTLTNDNYKKYYSFIYGDKGLTLKPKHEGMVNKESLKGFVNSIATSEDALEQELPYSPVIIESKQKKGVAYSFAFYDNEENTYELNVTPIIGNLTKNEDKLSSKIETLNADDILLSPAAFLEKEEVTLRNAFMLTPEAVGSVDKDNYSRYIMTHLQKLVPQLKDKITYKQRLYWQLKKSDLSEIKVSDKSCDLSFTVDENELFYTLKAFITIEGKKHDLAKKNIGESYYFVKHKDTYYLNKTLVHCKALSNFKEIPFVQIVKDDFESYYNNYIKPLSKLYPVKLKNVIQEGKTINEKDVIKQVYLSDLSGYIIIKPILSYKDQKIEVLSNEKFEALNGNLITRFTTNKNDEKEFIETVKGLHPKFETQQQSFFHLNKKEFVANTWFIDAIDTLKKKDIEVFGFDELKEMNFNKNKPVTSLSVNSGIDWFDVDITISFGDQKVSLKDLKKVIVNKENYVKLSDGTLGVLPEEWVEKYAHVFRAGNVKKDSIEVSKYQFSVIDSLFDEVDPESEWAKKHLELKQKLKTFNNIKDIKEPKGVKATLRDYQKEGLNWLNFLDEYGFGGCLADDMGLGKTIQIISFFKHLKNKGKKNKQPNLIVLPTSLIFNWQEEIKKFCPSLTVKVVGGAKRTKSTEDFEKFDLIIITYGLMVRDVDYLKDFHFNYIVLDESQAIKNPTSKRFKAARLLKANNRLVLTGTPIENNTFDLFAQMTFVNPGLLGSMASFKKNYATEIDKNKNKEVAKELTQLINPFLLRRTKEQVATELPEKTEQILYCTMEKEQQKVYDAYKNEYRNYLMGKIDKEGLGKSKMYVLEGLTKLRQICDSPKLIKDDIQKTDESIKIKELLRHISEKTNNHKILVFSQFVTMLGLIKEKLDEAGIKYEYLDGKTKDRQEKVNNFQNDDEVRVFLISLKAGGTGLNLTAADYVYIVDPWWNPAVEAQAIDRCYRIGQTKKVMAYKMICKNTIEEKIIKHQEGKKKLSSELIQTDESYVKALSKESIQDLFS